MKFQTLLIINIYRFFFKTEEKKKGLQSEKDGVSEDLIMHFNILKATILGLMDVLYNFYIIFIIQLIFVFKKWFI